MLLVPRGYEARVRRAVAHYWQTLGVQADRQRAGQADRGARSAVTGGKQMDGFCALVSWVVAKNGMPGASIHVRNHLELPGYFRPTKRWDLIVVHREQLVAAIEFKSQVGPSFGNNFNNRTEEALGNAVDLWTAYREGAFGTAHARPWVGWLMFLEDCAGSTTPVVAVEPHFKMFPEFQRTSYAQRYELLLRKLLLEKHYDGAALLMSRRADVDSGNFREPAVDLGIKKLLIGLGAQVQQFLATE